MVGDKENHIASAHFTQMLYIWPYFLFFSWPVLYQSVVVDIINMFRLPLQGLGVSRLSTALSTAAGITSMALVVRYNTIVHPFTLADNRHYMFYIFRILLRHPSIKYGVIPVYYFGASLCISALGHPSRKDTENKNRDDSQSSPHTPKSRNIADESKHPEPSLQQSSSLTDDEEDISTNRTAFTLVFLLATALSLITAPLVEPRYFILPWVIWRIHLPNPIVASPSSSSSPSPHPFLSNQDEFTTTTQPLNKRLRAQPPNLTESCISSIKTVITFLLQDPRAPLYVESLWFLLINLGTCYIFLRWEFEWKTEAPGKVQRFMW